MFGRNAFKKYREGHLLREITADNLLPPALMSGIVVGQRRGGRVLSSLSRVGWSLGQTEVCAEFTVVSESPVSTGVTTHN